MIDLQDSTCIQVNGKGAILFDEGIRNKLRRYNYDHVFDESASQDTVYKATTAPLVKDVMNGMNAAVFACKF